MTDASMTTEDLDDTPGGTDGEPQRRSLWIPWVFVGGMVLVIIVNAIMVMFAVNSWTGVIEPAGGTYRQGLRYDERIAEADAQEAMGWAVTQDFANQGDQAGRFSVTYRDGDGRVVDDARVTAFFVRPIGEGHDFEVVLSYQGDGTYGQVVDFPLAGQWQVIVTAESARGSYELAERLIVR